MVYAITSKFAEKLVFEPRILEGTWVEPVRKCEFSRTMLFLAGSALHSLHIWYKECMVRKCYTALLILANQLKGVLCCQKELHGGANS